MSSKVWRLLLMAIPLRFTDHAFACTASTPQKVAKSAGNATDRLGGADRRRRLPFQTRLVGLLSFVSSSTWTVMGASLQDASPTAKTSTSGWSVKAGRSPIVSILPNTSLMKTGHAKRKRACGERSSICLGIGVKDRASRISRLRHRRCCADWSSGRIPVALGEHVLRSEAARKRTGIWKTALGAVALTATMTALLAKASADTWQEQTS